MSKKLSSISTKFTMVTVIFTIIFIISVFLSIEITVENVLSQNIIDEIKRKANILNSNIEELKVKVLNSTVLFEDSSRIISIFNNKDREEALNVGKQAMESLGLNYFVITDNEGKVFIRAHEPEKFGDSIANQVNIQKALKGERSVGIEDGSVVKFSIRAGAPLKDNQGNIIGAISIGYVLSNNEFVDKQKKLFDCDVTIFSGLERIATTITDNAGKRIIGTKMDNQDIINTVFKEGKLYYGNSIINAEKYYVAYLPVSGADGKNSGMIFLGQKAGIINSLKNKLTIIQLIVLLAFGILLSVSIILLVKFMIVKRILFIKEMFKDIAEGKGDLTKRIIIKSKDEIGELSEYFNRFIESIHSIIKKIITETENVNKSIDVSDKIISELSEDLEETSSTVEQLTAGMEETASSTQEINTTSGELEMAVEGIAEKAQEGTMSANEISKKAISLKERSEVFQNEAEKTRMDIKKVLDEALVKVKEVEKIKTLSEAILQISSQTNLLALNAAIESARAGESGRGFSVVAEEIRKLAEDSKMTVNEISRTVNTVFDAVGNLVKVSQSTMRYIETKVLDSYKESVVVGENYNKDAILINDMVTDLSATSEELLASIKTVSEAINDISKSSNEGAEGTNAIAYKVTNIRDRAQAIAYETSQVKGSADRLKDLVLKFKV